MSIIPKPDKTVLIAATFILCVLSGFCFTKIHQPNAQTLKIYKQALQDYQNKDYQNSYYLFSKIGVTSNLRPAAIYRQSLCARELGDSKSELSAYQTFLRYYPKNKLADEVKYKAAQILIETEPQTALNYFEEIMNSDADKNYKAASQYYVAKIKSKSSDNIEIEQAYRHYLQKYPDGRLAADVADSWLNLKTNISSQDYVLLAKAYYNAGKNSLAAEMISNADVADSWAMKASLAKKFGYNSQLKDLVYQGVTDYPDKVSKLDYQNAVMDYLKTEPTLYIAASNLTNTAKGKNKDYIWSLKCRYAPYNEKLNCYNELYSNYPKTEYYEDIIPNVVLYRALNKDYQGANNAAQDFIKNYPSSSKIPMVMFWLAKSDKQNAQTYYKQIFNNYPDNYYAYRAFWELSNIKTATANAQLEYKPVEYPAKHSGVLYNLQLVGDYELIEKYTDDEFVKSWAQFQKGNYSQSINTAKSAIDKLEVKPPKNDIRWRLAYPMVYYDQIQTYSKQYGNNTALILGLIREESHFNSNAQSGVGAAGLMQLMPSTALEIDGSASDLLTPETNIKLGNMYYSKLHNELNGLDVSAIAAYNGGIGSVQNWKNRLIYNDTDEFIEQIPYEETRNYVKKVFASYWNYTRIYQK